MFKRVYIVFFVIGLSFAILPVLYNLHKNRNSISKYGLFASSNCRKLEKWYPRTIDSLLVVNVTDNKYRKGVGKMILLENNSEILFGRVSYPSELIMKGDILCKNKNSLILNIKREDENISWDIREVYPCKEYYQ